MYSTNHWNLELQTKLPLQDSDNVFPMDFLRHTLLFKPLHFCIQPRKGNSCILSFLLFKLEKSAIGKISACAKEVMSVEMFLAATRY